MLINLLIYPYPNGEENGSGPETIPGTGDPPKVNQFFRLVDPVITPTFNEIGSLNFAVILHTARTND